MALLPVSGQGFFSHTSGPWSYNFFSRDRPEVAGENPSTGPGLHVFLHFQVTGLWFRVYSRIHSMKDKNRLCIRFQTEKSETRVKDHSPAFNGERKRNRRRPGPDIIKQISAED